MPQPTVYDKVPYSSFTFPQTRPAHLGSLATYYGIHATDPEHARVLELGCGNGTNLISFAYVAPDSAFVGIDLSDVHIQNAMCTSETLGLANTTFHCADLLEIDEKELGSFDYIIAHGLFSWVPDIVRQKVLKIYRECLSVNGVGVISYNTFPGCRLRQTVWEMMQYHTAYAAEPMVKVHAGVDFAKFVAQASPEGSFQKSMMLLQLSQFDERTAENIFHDDFSEINEPFYFHEFARLIQANGLKYVCETDEFWPHDSPVDQSAFDRLNSLGRDVIRREQYLDYIKFRSFRSTIICRDEVELDRDPDPGIISNFYLSSQLDCDVPESELKSDALVKFDYRGEHTIGLSDPLTKCALDTLSRMWCSNISLPELLDRATELCGLGEDDARGKASATLFELAKQGFVDMSITPTSFQRLVSDHPFSSAFVRWQLETGCANITNLAGMNLTPDSDFMRLLLMLADGTRTLDEIVSDASDRMKVDDTDHKNFLAELPAAVRERFEGFARLGLLLK